jgi:hypothetical protein
MTRMLLAIACGAAATAAAAQAATDERLHGAVASLGYGPRSTRRAASRCRWVF